jgi:membrane-bound serine protease (ClpP class)
MKTWLLLLSLFLVSTALAQPPAAKPAEAKRSKVFIIPVRNEIYPPLVYLIRRSVKEAIEADADLLVLDMDTPGGRVDTTREIISILNEFKGDTATFVNKDAFSAGAFIAVATKRIYMAPQSVIGAAAPIILAPGGDGPQAIPDTYEKKMNSAVRAIVRAAAEKNGYNIAVVEAMIDKNKGLTIDGVQIAKEGEILTLTNTEAEKEYGNPPKKLLSSGTVESIDDLLSTLGYAGAERHEIKVTGMEQIGTWLNRISPLLLIIGIVGIYIEFKTPGFGLPGIVGIAAFALYFLGGYVAGLSGLEWLVVFIIGLILVVLEFFVLPGHMVFGLIGSLLMLAAVVMAMVDVYPQPGPGLPKLPTFDKFELPLQQILIAMAGGALGIWAVSRVLPRTQMYRAVVSSSASGVKSEQAQAEQRQSRQGQIGIAVSMLRPGGKARFGDDLLDVISQGEVVPKGTRVRITGYSGPEAVVEVVKEA